MKQDYRTRGTCPELLDVGQEPLAVVWKHDEPTVYTNGLKLRIVVPNNVEFIEQVRVNEGLVEYQFTTGEVQSEWSSVRSKAFQECVQKSNTTLPMQRSVIFGPSHVFIQQAIRKQFPQALGDCVDEEEDEEPVTRRRLTWGDEKPKVVDEPTGANRYGGWGLTTIKTIPNRFELGMVSTSWADLVMDSDDLDEHFEMDDDREVLYERELRSFSMFDAAFDPLDPEEDILPQNQVQHQPRRIEDDEKTVFVNPVEEPEEEVVMMTEEMTSEDNSEDTTDEDEENDPVPASETPMRKRIRIEPCSVSEESPAKMFIAATPAAPCKSYEDGLKESDFWLLHDEQPIY